MNLDCCTSGQREIVTTLDAPLMVAAGAGSGKTFTLTQRIVNALSPAGGGKPCLSSIDEVLAITFTKRAAAELRSRIKALLQSEGLTDQALAVDGAWISTIHGMAGRVIREHALEVGVDPTFEMLSEAQADALRTRAVDAVVAHVGQVRDPLMRELLASTPLFAEGVRGEGLIDQAMQLLARVEAMPLGFDGLVLAQPASAPGSLLREMTELGQAFLATAQTWAKPGKREVEAVEQLEGALEEAGAWLERGGQPSSFLDEGFDADAYRKAFYSFPPTSDKFHEKKDDADFFASYRSEYARLSEEVEAGVALRRAYALVRLARMVDEEFTRLKGPSRLDNADLLRTCARALAGRPEIAQAYREQFKLIMVDEFQDTDKLQVAVIGALAKPGFANVCTVGDAQQSIYRFRGADVNVFFEYREELRAQSSRARFVSLPDNFRSHGDVLKLVDAVFAQQRVFGGEFLHLEPRSPINAQADPVFEGNPRIRLDFVHYKASTPRTKGVAKPEAVAVAARHVAEHFASLRERGARVGDMALLLGGMTNANVYAQALRDAGIESVIAGGSVFAGSLEARLVADVLRLAVNMNDEPALFNVLTSPLFAVSDDVLLAIASSRDADGRFSPRSLAHGFSLEDAGTGCGLGSADEQALGLARETLGRFAARARKGSTSRALRALLVETGMLDRLEREGAVGLASAGNFAKAFNLVEGFEKAGTGVASISHAFAEHLRCSKEAPGSLATVESDFVRIMTVHSSKGLEFPHVAVADLGGGVVSRETLNVENIGQHTYAAMSTSAAGEHGKKIAKLRKFAREDALPANAADARTPGELYALLSEHARAQSLAEAQRLLYVALTRASRSLMLSHVFRSDPKGGYEGEGVYGDLFAALPWDTESSASTTMVDYGGSAPARVTLEYLTEPAPLEEPESPSEAGAAVDARAAGEVPHAAAQAQPFVVALRDAAPPPKALSCDFAREGTYSYTSLEHAPLPWDEIAPGHAPVDELERSGNDDATALGTAFHLMAQRAVEQMNASASRDLACPPPDAIAACARRCALSDGQAQRLDAALDRWFASDAARDLAAFGAVAAEVPFAVRVEREGTSLLLEGEIDALATDGSGRALFVDYKTGGFASETESFLRDKHLLQAQCYAYALLREGFSSVEARFVRVEQPDPACPSQPQAVTYAFGANDADALAAAVVSACPQQPEEHRP